MRSSHSYVGFDASPAICVAGDILPKRHRYFMSVKQSTRAGFGRVQTKYVLYRAHDRES
jgi:hypothetical protein